MNDRNATPWAERFAYVFNRTALGIGVLFGVWMAVEGYWWRVGGVVLLIGLYFALHKAVDAP